MLDAVVNGKLTNVGTANRVGALNVTSNKLLGVDLLPQAQVVVVDRGYLATCINDSLCCALAEARQLKLERGQGKIRVGLAEEFDARLLAQAVDGVGTDNGADGNRQCGVNAGSSDKLLQARDGEGSVRAASKVEEAALGEQTGDGRLTTLKVWDRFAVAGTRKLTLVTTTGSASLGASGSTTTTSVL